MIKNQDKKERVLLSIKTVQNIMKKKLIPFKRKDFRKLTTKELSGYWSYLVQEARKGGIPL